MRALLCAALATVTGCQSLECGEGTFEDGDKCVGYDPKDKTPPITTANPPGGRTRSAIPEVIALTTDEPARIYYTTDGTDPDPTSQAGESSPALVVGVEQGSTLKYFAIDPAGNREQLVTVTYDSDQKAPARVTNMQIALAGAVPTITWTNPSDADFAGVVVARVADAIDVDPTPGMTYTAPASLSTSLQIVSVGKNAQFVDTARPAGPVRYVAWTFDDVGNYSTGTSARTQLALGSLTAQYTYTVANNTLTRTQSPANLDLANTTAALAGTTLTLSLSVKNTTAQYFQNPKVEVTSVTNGAFSQSDGTADGFAFKSLGPNLLAPDATVTKNLVFTGVAAGTVVTINLTFAQHSSIFSTAGRFVQAQQVIDSGAGAITPVVAAITPGPNDRANGRVRPGLFVGGRYLDIATTHGSIERWDMVMRKFVASVRLTEDDTQRLNIQGLYASPTGNGTYAVLKYAGRRRRGVAELVQIDEGLHVIARVPLPNDERGFTRSAISADGTLMAIPLQAGIALVDLTKMEQLDASPASPASIDLFEPRFTNMDQIRAVQFFDGNNGLLAMARHNGEVAVIRRVADDYTVTLSSPAANAKGYSMATATDNKIWLAFQTGLRVFDPVTATFATVTYAAIPNGLAIMEGKVWVIRDTRDTIDQISSTGAIQRTVTVPVNTGAYGHWLEVAR